VKKGNQTRCDEWFQGPGHKERIWVDVACLGVEDDLPSNSGLGMLARRRKC
jgi:hypothetical protein